MRKPVAILLVGILMGMLLAPAAIAQQVDEAAYNDYPLRWPAYALHPAGVVFDLALVKPMTFVVCVMPWFFGVSAGECPEERTTPRGE